MIKVHSVIVCKRPVCKYSKVVFGVKMDVYVLLSLLIVLQFLDRCLVIMLKVFNLLLWPRCLKARMHYDLIANFIWSDCFVEIEANLESVF